MFAGVLTGNGHKLGFNKRYDLTIDNIPCQVKTIMPNECNFNKIRKRITDRVYEPNNGRLIDENDVRREIISLLQEKHTLVDDAIKQLGRIGMH